MVPGEGAHKGFGLSYSKLGQGRVSVVRPVCGARIPVPDQQESGGGKLDGHG